MNTFSLKVVSSNKIFFDGECRSLSIPFTDGGNITFLAKHENTVLPIENGEMKIETAEGTVIEAFVSDGFLEFLDNEALVVCVSVELPEDIDKLRAEDAIIRATEKLRQRKSGMEYISSKASISRAMERIKVKNRHNI